MLPNTPGQAGRLSVEKKLDAASSCCHSCWRGHQLWLSDLPPQPRVPNSARIAEPVLHRNIFKDENISLQIKNKPPANGFGAQEKKMQPKRR
jgi:hypothetical protein